MPEFDMDQNLNKTEPVTFQQVSIFTRLNLRPSNNWKSLLDTKMQVALVLKTFHFDFSSSSYGPPCALPMMCIANDVYDIDI